MNKSITETYNWASFSNDIKGLYKSKQIPYSATFELTPLCNFNCNMCYVHMTQSQMQQNRALLSSDDWIRLAKETASFGTIKLQLTGGEIFTRVDFREIYEQIYSMGFLITLRSNGYLIDDKTLEWLKRNKPMLIQITMYGASDDTYQKVCGINDGFTVVSQNIDRILDAGINVRSTMTITKDNYYDYDRVVKWGEDRGLSIRGYAGLINRRTGTTKQILGLKYQRPKEYANFDTIIETEYNSESAISRTRAYDICKTFGHSFSITWDGKMVPCVGTHTRLENPFEGSLVEAYTRMINNLEQVKRPAACNNCKFFDFCFACPAQFESYTGSQEQTCDELCLIAKRRFYDYVINNQNVKAEQDISDNYCE